LSTLASLVLYGTPPFHVYYCMQRDKEPAQELVKMFNNSRGEMTLQPSQSGRYIYSFSELKGPTVNQIVHPLASAVFVGSSGRGRLTIDSCAKNSVDVDVRRQKSNSNVMRSHRFAGHRTMESEPSACWPTKVRHCFIFWY
jgi:hypothetical protein